VLNRSASPIPTTIFPCGLVLLGLFSSATMAQSCCEPMRRLEVNQAAPWERLPEVDLSRSLGAVLPDPYRLDGDAAYLDPAGAELADPANADRPPTVKPGSFQRLMLSETYLVQPSGGDLGASETAINATFGVPIPSRTWPMLVTPEFDLILTQGPAVPDVPPQLYDASLEFRWMRKWTPRLGSDLAVAPGYHADFQTSSSEAIRITGRGVGAWDWRENLKLVLGATYLDRRDVQILPVAGLVWKPNDDAVWELVFPQPRIAGRFCVEGVVEYWAYISGELGGGQWAVERTTGTTDVLTYRDIRVMIGLERKVQAPYGFNGRVEIGYVFARELEYASMPQTYDLHDTMMVRAVAAF